MPTFEFEGSLEDLKKVKAILEDLADDGKIGSSTLNLFSNLSGGVNSFSKQAANSFSSFKESVAKNASEASKKVKESTDQIAQNFKSGLSGIIEYRNRIEQAFDNNKLKQFGISSTKLVGQLAVLHTVPLPSFNSFTEGDGKAQKLTSSLNDLTAVYKNMGGKDSVILEVFGDLAEATDLANSLTNSMYKTSAAMGTLDEYLDAAGDGFKNSGTLSDSFNEKLTEISNSVSMTREQVEPLAAILMQGMPRAMQKVNDVSVSGREKMNELAAAIKVARGAGMQEADVLRDVVARREKFNQTSQESLEVISRMSFASRQLKLPLDVVKESIGQASDRFVYFKDNTNSLINVMGRLAPALTKVGASASAMKGIFSSISSNLLEMGVAERAYLSSQTGGPGGLRGSAQIQLLKEQGKTEEIFKMASDTLMKQFGGRVVTAEEASRDEGAARQYYKQIQLATQGPNKLVNSEEQASLLFKAMRSGEGGAQIFEKERTLEETIEQGNEITKSQQSQLVEMTNLLKEISVTNALSLVAETKKLKDDSKETFISLLDKIENKESSPIYQALMPRLKGEKKDQSTYQVASIPGSPLRVSPEEKTDKFYEGFFKKMEEGAEEIKNKKKKATLEEAAKSENAARQSEIDKTYKEVEKKAPKPPSVAPASAPNAPPLPPSTPPTNTPASVAPAPKVGAVATPGESAKSAVLRIEFKSPDGIITKVATLETSNNAIKKYDIERKDVGTVGFSGSIG